MTRRQGGQKEQGHVSSLARLKRKQEYAEGQRLRELAAPPQPSIGGMKAEPLPQGNDAPHLALACHSAAGGFRYPPPPPPQASLFR